MLKNLSFAYKITLLPAVAGLSFLLILATFWFNAKQSSALLEEIEKGHYASLEMGRELYKNLGLIQRSFQDAAAMADEDMLVEAEVIRDEFVAQLTAARDIPVIDPERIEKIERDFSDYYGLASATTRALVTDTGGEDIFENLSKVAVQVARLQEDLEAMTESDKSSVVGAFSAARSNQNRATLTMMLVVAVSAGMLVFLSFLIIRMVSTAVNKAVSGMDALSHGDLTRQAAHDSKDEIGMMVKSVGDVTGIIDGLAREIGTLIEAVREGRLNVRGDSGRFQGAYAELVDNINELIDAFVAPIGVTADYVERIANGDIPPEIRDDYHGDFNQTKGNLNSLIAVMNGLIEQTTSVTNSVRDGKLSQRGDADGFSGVWGELVSGLNDTMNAVTDPIRDVSAVISNMAKGDMTKTISASYAGDFAKLTDDVNSTVAKLTNVISRIKESSESVSNVAGEIANGNQSLSSRTETQAASLDETTRSMAEMTTMVRESADNARQANELVSQAREKAQRGGEVVGSAVRAMSEINESSQKIARIISVIDEMAFQTNLLALNAAVEAARAGEQGRGFAVVASEVRNLAGRSATAAKEINDLISDSVLKVEDGSRLVDESGKTLEEIVTAVKDVTDVVGDIATASSRQAKNIEGVNSTIQRMQDVTEQNAAMVEEAAASSLTMGDEASQLKEMMDFFRVETMGESTTVRKIAVLANIA